MKTIKSIEYALMNLDAIKRDVRYYDESLRESGMRYDGIAIVVELKGDGSFTHRIMCVDWSLNEIAPDAYMPPIPFYSGNYKNRLLKHKNWTLD